MKLIDVLFLLYPRFLWEGRGIVQADCQFLTCVHLFLSSEACGLSLENARQSSSAVFGLDPFAVMTSGSLRG